MHDFISDVPKVYLSDPSEIEPGMQLWSVGQGGVSSVQTPYYKGEVLAVGWRTGMCNVPIKDADWALLVGDSYMSHVSYRDSHILLQQYNNWYLCDSQEKAQQVYDYIKTVWDSNPEYEARRKRYDDDTKQWMEY